MLELWAEREVPDERLRGAVGERRVAMERVAMQGDHDSGGIWRTMWTTVTVSWCSRKRTEMEGGAVVKM